MTGILLTGSGITIADIEAIARRDATVDVSDAVRDQLIAARRIWKVPQLPASRSTA